MHYAAHQRISRDYCAKVPDNCHKGQGYSYSTLLYFKKIHNPSTETTNDHMILARGH